MVTEIDKDLLFKIICFRYASGLITPVTKPSLVIAIYKSIFDTDVGTLIKKLDESNREGGVLPYYGTRSHKEYLPDEVKKYFENKLSRDYIMAKKEKTLINEIYQ